MDSRTPRRRRNLTALICRVAPLDGEGKVTAQVSWSNTKAAG
jgi:hypothetical protein